MNRWPVLIAALGLTPPAQAQQLPVGVGLYLGGGLEMIGTADGGRFTPGPSLEAGVVRQLASSRLAVRAGVTYYERDRSYVFGDVARETAAGINTELGYDLGQALFRPYVLVGTGVYRLQAFARGRLLPPPVSQLSGAFIGGLGFRRSVGSAKLFAELRYLRFTNGRGFADHLMPLALGVRF